ncbi:MAG: HAMP domain-containing sensor histidine kinase [Patescibacteria group bacterium]
MEISRFKECKELNLHFFECPTTLFLLTGFITIILILSSFVIVRRYYSDEIVFFISVFISVVMIIISYFVHVGTSKVASSKKRLQESNNKLSETLIKLKEAEKKQDEFTHLMVHDLRSPLNGIRMVSEVILNDLKKQHKNDQLEPINLINGNAVHMLTLVNDILDVAKIEAGMFKLEKKKSDFSLLAADMVRYFKPLALGKNIKLELIVEEKLPPIEYDESAMRQVFENLISNSLKFTPAGGRIQIQIFKHSKKHNLNEEAQKLRIEWNLKGGDEKLDNYPESIVVGITDNGQGISIIGLSRLFNKFEQAEGRSKGTERGTGLGLIIVKGIVEAHGGIVGVASKESQGTTFYFNLPIN